MPGKQAKILPDSHTDEMLLFADTTRHPLRNRVVILLSTKAGLRAAEIANLTWEMLLNPSREIGPAIELRDHAAKMNHGRTLPIHPDLRKALVSLRDCTASLSGPVIRSERGRPMIRLASWSGFRVFTGCSVWTAAHPILDGAPLLPVQRGLYTKRADPYEMSNCWLGIARCKRRNVISTVTVMPNGGWYR